MPLTQQYICTGTEGENIYLFSLSNNRDSWVTLTNYGGIILRYERMVNHERLNMVLGFDDPRDYQDPSYLSGYPWFGCAVGRYANRIGHAQFKLDGKAYRLAANNGPHLLHGGKNGFDRKTWGVIAMGDEDEPWLELGLLSPDGDEGFPGNLRVILRFQLDAAGNLWHRFTATTDEATPCNLTHHSYFNLNNGEGTIHQHEVMIAARQMLDQDEELVANGQVSDVEGTAYDLRTFQTLQSGLARIPEYDKSYLIDRSGKALALMGAVRFPPRRLQLEVHSTEPVLHFYSGKWIPDLRPTGGRYGPWSGLCLETHSYPNAVNMGHFPSTILRPGEVYRHETVYKPMEY